MAIIYLHGFASSGNTPKAHMLRQHFPDVTIAAPDLPPNPVEAVEHIKSLVKDLYAKGERSFLFIGTSMGGFYAWYCSALYDAPAVMVNPAIKPHQTTAQWIGMNKNHATGSEFEWKNEYLTELEAMAEYANKNYDPSQVSVVVALDDKVIDANPTIQHFVGSEVQQYETGGHRFDNWNEIMPHVEKRYGNIKEQFQFPDID